MITPLRFAGAFASAALLTTLLSPTCSAELWLPNVFGDHMVLQREMPVPVWGRAKPGATVTVALSGPNKQQQETAAGEDGAWRVTLDPLAVGEPFEMTITGDGEKTFTDVVVGEVWICSGQSNMQWRLGGVQNGKLDLLTADRPNIRLLTVTNSGSQTPKDNFPNVWERCTPAIAREYSAVGYHFGRRLQDVLDVAKVERGL